MNDVTLIIAVQNKSMRSLLAWHIAVSKCVKSRRDPRTRRLQAVIRLSRELVAYECFSRRRRD